MNYMIPLVSLSVVSHGQSELIKFLFADLNKLTPYNFEVIVTINFPENESVYEGHPFSVKIIRNSIPKGFGANHNAAFNKSIGQFFSIVNPDIRIPVLDLAALVGQFRNMKVGAIAPVILSAKGCVEDNARRFPTFIKLTRRFLLGSRGPDYKWTTSPIEVDWLAGMFVIFRPTAFKALDGFDEKRFFMYFEDVDICARLWRSGWTVLLSPQASVVHCAQRASHRDIKHMRWHVTSAVRYLTGF